MKLKLLLLLLVSIPFVGCQFSETMTLNEDGTGTMQVTVNLSEMMAMGGGAMVDSATIKIDTVIKMKQLLNEKADSISKLSKSEQLKLKALKGFNYHIKMDSEKSEMIYAISTNFKEVVDANDIISRLERIDDVMPGKKTAAMKTTKEEGSQELIGVNYSFVDGVFKRDAYIKDKVKHQQQVDSLQQASSFMGSSKYSLKYTFPRKIDSASHPDATYSADKKTIVLSKPFFEYFTNPDVLDLEVRLEK